MLNKINHRQNLSIFLQYLTQCEENGIRQIPSLIELSQQLGVSVATLREQMEVARIMGLIEVKPRTGIQKMPYSFSKTITTSITYAMVNSPDIFMQIADLRKHLEAAYWKEAASKMGDLEIRNLYAIIEIANRKLHGTPPVIPHEEHKHFHLLMYQKLNNSFVTGLLEAYWHAYEDLGLDVYNDLGYLEQVWAYHQKTVDAIAKGDLDKGYQSFADHMDMISRRTQTSRQGSFE